ncbi:MAG: glycosyltransferase family 39 protein [Magnetococcales bacterium]|nr:glycosyltransferase family 39 protein [Magnetococcales bacterium]
MEQQTTSIYSTSQKLPLSTNQIAWAGTIALVTIHLFFLLWASPIYRNSDDSIYSRYAHQIAEGTYEYNHNSNQSFQHRYGVTVPTALGYKLFGVNRYSLVLWAWICSILTLTLLFNFALRRYGPAAAFIAGLIFATNTKQISTALMLSVDVIVSLFMFLAAIILYEARQSNAKEMETFFSVSFVTTLILATLSKLVVITIFPAITILLLIDLKNRRNIALWLKIISYGLLFGALYLTWMHFYTGNFMSRFSGTIDVVQSLGSMNITVFKDMMDNLPARLTYKPALMILSIPGVLIPLLLALSLTNIFTEQKLKLFTETSHWWLFILSITLFIWVVPTSFSPFIPLLLVPRYFLPLIPFFSLIAGVALASTFNKSLSYVVTKQFFWWLCFIYLLIYPLLNTLGFFKLGVLIVTVPVLFALFWDKATFLSSSFGALRTPILSLLYLLVFSMLPSHFILNNIIGEKPWQTAEREIVQRYFLDDKESKVVYTNKRGIIAINFLIGYENFNNLELVNWDRVTTKKIAAEVKHYIYINKHVIKGLQATYSRTPPPFVNSPPPDWELVEESKGIAIYTTQNTPNFN